MIENNDIIINNKNKCTLHLKIKPFMFKFESLEDLGYENLELSTFINDCNYDTQRCNITVYQNSILYNSFSEPILFGRYTFLREFINDKKPIYFLGLDDAGIIVYRSNELKEILDGLDVIIRNQKGNQISYLSFSELNRESAGYDIDQKYTTTIPGPYLYHCRRSELEFGWKIFENCLAIGDNNEFNVITYYVHNMNPIVLNFSQIYENYTIKTNETLISNTFTAKDIFSSFYYYCTSDINNQVYSFVYSDKANITHVIQLQFSSPRYCLFFSDKTNSSILFDIYQNKVIINHNHLNLNISRHLHENSTRSISYFMNPKEFTKNVRNYTEPTNAPLENDILPNNYVSDENNSPTLTVSFSTLTISLLLSFINIL